MSRLELVARAPAPFAVPPDGGDLTPKIHPPRRQTKHLTAMEGAMVMAAGQMQDLIHEFKIRISASQHGPAPASPLAEQMTETLTSIEEDFRVVTFNTERIREALTDGPGAALAAGAEASAEKKKGERARDTSPKRPASLVH